MKFTINSYTKLMFILLAFNLKVYNSNASCDVQQV
jgi:hypothetical protein